MRASSCTVLLLPAATSLTALLAAAALVACGGEAASASGASQTSAETAAEMPAPLFDDRGRPLLSPAAIVPADTAARTRSGLYASAMQYEWEALVTHPYTVLLDLDGPGSDAAALASAEQVHGGRDAAGVAYYIRARDPSRAARFADSLSDRGFAPVFVVRSAKSPG